MGALYESLCRPILFRLDAELAHEHGITFLKILQSLGPGTRLLNHFLLEKLDRPIELAGITFPNPVGLAAGLDKNAETAAILPALGFGFAEVGTVTPEPQPGNPTPRLFRYPDDKALINRMGFNNAGAPAMAARLKRFFPKGKRAIPLGVNIGMNKTTPIEKALEDYQSCIQLLAAQADFFTVNISSPNTMGLRKLQEKNALDDLLAGITKSNSEWAKKHQEPLRPVFLKIAPDLTFHDLDRIIESVQRHAISGLVATNTTVSRPDDWNYPKEDGGLSGQPLHQLSLRAVKYISRVTGGKLPLIGVGGIMDQESMGRMFDAGAHLVQIYTGFIYRGLGFPRVLARSARGTQRSL